MAAEHQTNVLRRIDQFLPNGLRPVSGRKFVALAFFATAVRIEKRMGQNDYPVVAVFSDSIRPRAQSSASSRGANSKAITSRSPHAASWNS